MHSADIRVTYLIKSFYTLLIALILLIFAHRIYTLFISNISSTINNDVLKCIQTPNISQLKNVLIEIIVITLFLKCLEIVFVNIGILK
ncbi:YqhA family protein [Flavobacterium segetis]|uniref:YqhA family protein n=1 Tax=Flavobacterium segetis TaxID=271157 RepID=UPI0009FBBF0F